MRLVAAGFAAGEPHVGGGPEHGPGPSADDLAPIMASFVHPDIARYLARVDGAAAGGGAAWERDRVLGVFGTATLPEFRRRGVQAAITVAALRDASPAADLAIATTAPGSTSQRTFERLGFRVLYTRAIFVRAPQVTAA
ncbi:MAG: GNAT family N-acetyltransferase [Vicinamibacteria bacterium]|nr:GNAT family N-acetyltransferase [Vicinamibacteria bacterium]